MLFSMQTKYKNLNTLTMKRNRLFPKAALAAAAGLFVLLPLAGNAQVAIDETNFPDSAFRAYVQENFDTDQNGSLSDAERETVTTIYMDRNPALKSLQGIGYFPSLIDLYCYDNAGLTSLDVSRNPALRTLECQRTGLTSLDVSQNPDLVTLCCSNTGITNLDVSQNPDLAELFCSYTGITSLDVSQNPDLVTLYCDNTGITSLDVSQNPALEWLLCSHTGLTSLDVSRNPTLNYLECDHTGLTSLDVSQNPALLQLNCSNTGITSLDVSRNTALMHLYVNQSKLSHIDLSQNPALQTVQLQANVHPVEAETGGTYDLSRIPGFDLSRVTWLQEPEIEGSLLRFNTEIISYFYDTRRLGGEELKAVFSLQAVPDLGNEQPGMPESAAGPLPFRARAENGVLHVENARGLVEVFNLQGRRVYAGLESRIPLPSQGVYIVRNQGRSLKVANL